MQEAPNEVEIDSNILIRTLQNTVAQQSIAIAQYQAGLEQLNNQIVELSERAATPHTSEPTLDEALVQ